MATFAALALVGLLLAAIGSVLLVIYSSLHGIAL